MINVLFFKKGKWGQLNGKIISSHHHHHVYFSKALQTGLSGTVGTREETRPSSSFFLSLIFILIMASFQIQIVYLSYHGKYLHTKYFFVIHFRWSKLSLFRLHMTQRLSYCFQGFNCSKSSVLALILYKVFWYCCVSIFT